MVDVLEDNRAFVSHFKELFNCVLFAINSEAIGKLSMMTFYHLIGVWLRKMLSGTPNDIGWVCLTVAL